jgi:hypothetical protein
VDGLAADYALRRYPSDSLAANAHTANAWGALLDSAYGGKGSRSGGGGGSLKGACFEHDKASCQTCTAAKDLRCPSIWCNQPCVRFAKPFGGHLCQPASVMGQITPPPPCSGNATGCGKCPAPTATSITNAAPDGDDTISTGHVNAHATLGLVSHITGDS